MNGTKAVSNLTELRVSSTFIPSTQDISLVKVKRNLSIRVLKAKIKLVNHDLVVFSEGNFWPRCLLIEEGKKAMFRGLVICSENTGRKERK